MKNYIIASSAPSFFLGLVYWAMMFADNSKRTPWVPIISLLVLTAVVIYVLIKTSKNYENFKNTLATITFFSFFGVITSWTIPVGLFYFLILGVPLHKFAKSKGITSAAFYLTGGFILGLFAEFIFLSCAAMFFQIPLHTFFTGIYNDMLIYSNMLLLLIGPLYGMTSNFFLWKLSVEPTLETK